MCLEKNMIRKSMCLIILHALYKLCKEAVKEDNSRKFAAHL